MASSRAKQINRVTTFRSDFYPSMRVDFGKSFECSDPIVVSAAQSEKLCKEPFTRQPEWKLNVRFHTPTGDVNINETLTVQEPGVRQDTPICIRQVQIKRHQYILHKADDLVEGAPTEDFVVELKLKDGVELFIEKKPVSTAMWKRLESMMINPAMVISWSTNLMCLHEPDTVKSYDFVRTTIADWNKRDAHNVVPFNKGLLVEVLGKPQPLPQNSSVESCPDLDITMVRDPSPTPIFAPSLVEPEVENALALASNPSPLPIPSPEQPANVESVSSGIASLQFGSLPPISGVQAPVMPTYVTRRTTGLELSGGFAGLTRHQQIEELEAIARDIVTPTQVADFNMAVNAFMALPNGRTLSDAVELILTIRETSTLLHQQVDLAAMLASHLPRP